MTPKQQAVIFDWNGTLLADVRQSWVATNEALALLGVPPITLAWFQREYDMPLRGTYVRAGCDGAELDRRINDVMATWSKRYEKDMDRLRLRRGAKGTLAFLAKQGYRAAILSNHTVEIISSHAQRLGIAHCFDEILANRSGEFKDVMHMADKGKRLKAYIQRRNIRKALVVGDSAEEIEIAHHYGFLGVGISGGYCSAERIRAARPDFMISSLAEIPAFAHKVFNRGGSL